MMIEAGARLDRYIVEAVIGEGGMAVVYRARHVHLGTVAALKVLSVPLASVQQRLLLEGRAQAALRHPNVVAVHDVIDVLGAPGLVMELVEGPSLAELIRARKLSLEQVDELARGIMDAVAAAHRLGIVHRDLKPGNVLLELRAGSIIPKVTDFGLAKAIFGPTSTPPSDDDSGAPVGTPAYMSPEQLREPRTVDARADIFALGALLYELVTGKQAFAGAHVIEIYTNIHAGRYVPPEELVPDLPERMRAAIAGALQTDRDVRLGSVEALREVWCGGEDPATLASAVSGVRWGDVVADARRLAARPRRGGGMPVARGTPDAEGSSVQGAEDPTLPAIPGAGRGAEPWRVAAPRRAAVVAGVVGVALLVVAGGAWWGWSTARRAASSVVEAPVPVEASPPVSAAAPAEPGPGDDASMLVPDGAGLAQPDLLPEPGADPAPAAGEAAPPDALPIEPVVSPPRSPSARAVAASSPAAAPESPSAAPDASAAAPPPLPASGSAAPPPAHLTVNSRPWSDRIVVDGEVALSLKTEVELPPGPHTLDLRAHDGRAVTQRIDLAPGQTLVFCWDFNVGAPCGG